MEKVVNMVAFDQSMFCAIFLYSEMTPEPNTLKYILIFQTFQNKMAAFLSD